MSYAITKDRVSEHSKNYRCLNCGSSLHNPTGSIDARRFCGYKCREEYFRR